MPAFRCSAEVRSLRSCSGVLTKDTVVLLWIHDVVPQPGVVGRNLVVNHGPILLEPFIEPGEEYRAGGAGLLNFTGESSVDGGHRLFVVSAVAFPEGFDVGNASAGRHPVFGNQGRHLAMILDECPQVSEITRRPF